MIVIRAVLRSTRTTSTDFVKRKAETIAVGSRNINFSLNAIGHITDFCAIYFHGSSNVVLVLKIQDVLKKLKHDEKHFKKEVTLNWIYGIIVTIEFYAFYIYIDTTNQRSFWLDVLSDSMMLTFHVNMFNAIRIIMLIRSNLSIWIKEIEISKEKKVNKGTEYWKEMFEIYNSIMESYNIFFKVFQELIVFIVTDTFLHTLVYIQSSLTLLTRVSSNDPTTHRFLQVRYIVLILIWVLVRLLFIMLLGIETEKFYIEMENTQMLSSKQLATPGCDEPEKNMYKNVQRLYQFSFAKAKLKGLFNMDAGLPLQLASVTTANAIVILQFALKK